MAPNVTEIRLPSTSSSFINVIISKTIKYIHLCIWIWRNKQKNDKHDDDGEINNIFKTEKKFFFLHDSLVEYNCDTFNKKFKLTRKIIWIKQSKNIYLCHIHTHTHIILIIVIIIIIIFIYEICILGWFGYILMNNISI